MTINIEHRDSISGNQYDVLDCINLGQLDYLLTGSIRGTRMLAEGRKTPPRVLPDESDTEFYEALNRPEYL